MNRPAHILMVSVPAHGHVNPSLAVITELVARGYRVSYVNDPSFREIVESTGASFVPYATALPLTDDPAGWPEDPVAIQEVFLDDALSMWSALLEAFEDDHPDLVLYDIAGFAGRALGERLGVPVVQLSSSFVGWDGGEEDLAEVFEAIRSGPGGPEHHRRFADWLAGAGAVQRDVEAFKNRPERCIALVPRALQPNADRVDERRVSFVGPCFGDRAHQGRWERPAGAEKVLLVSLGSAYTNQPAFYRACIEAFGDLPGWHTVLQIGRHTDLAALGEVPDTVEVHRWVPQLSVLAQADAFVTHAGMGGSSEGLFHAVPMIAVPQAVDQFANADALVGLGVARRLDTEQATAEALRAALLELVDDPAVAERLAVLSAAGRAEGGTVRAVDLIEAELKG
ncbi:macrolide family glycosyltransferase [Kitasatospora aureofaciens]|uniref:Glycosyl transferase n=1 Tax=Kitasatospora aureofaciens TaxID=1894 RepID=A0A1E7N603_KITAU|nr:macrolide family glycosyltransferase [Kitasatospora aureofaciens]QEV01312.1 glycosyl transferase [Streptomyces viridifaciens]ARF80068.1 glycosyl transferase [Kitasatospora aureofaciens]OEV36122.1 glycosyl transferase [Kitasatospora aureofaciens]UKZ07686.1 glycosyl transferase [Streptomyces viridifaciens]GGV02747.1 macrolide-inactivating glycosyltransferase [Kitasatospora aureofaciens]